MSNHRLLATLVALALAMILAACGGATASTPMPAVEAPAAPQAADSAVSEANRGIEAGGAAAPGAANESKAQQPAGQRLVIKTATVSLQV